MTCSPVQPANTPYGTSTLIELNAYPYKPCAGKNTVQITDIKDDMYSNLILEVYPNPSTDTIELHSIHQNNCKLILMNITGQVVYSENINSTASVVKKQVDVKQLPQGMYLIQLSNYEGVYSRKIIKN